MNFLPGGKLLHGDWVEEAKLLFFIKMEVTSRSPKKEKRLNEAKRKMQETDRKLSFKKKKRIDGTLEVQRTEQDIEALDNKVIFEGNDDNVQPPVVLMYNSVREYISAIHQIWSH